MTERVGVRKRILTAGVGSLLIVGGISGCAQAGVGGLPGTGQTHRSATSTGRHAADRAPRAPSGLGASSARGGGVTTGPGPQSPYRVQPQPAAKSCHYRYQANRPLPDPACTPGARNPQVTQANLRSTICRSGFTSSIRPPREITDREKSANARSYGYTGNFHTAEYDHLISLELGGDPNDARNLWVEPNDRSGSTTTNGKDAVENAAHDAVCSGQLSLADVQNGIATNWIALGHQLGVPGL